MSQQTKVCSTCHVEKPASAFYRRVTRKGTVTLTSECRECTAARRRRDRDKEREREKRPEYKARRARWNKAHRDTMNQARREYYKRTGK